ncbi:MAG: hypothetical protein EPN20_14760 [Magnetospirillum sp.]|nr:MAG: hypothetical protein EPN20_14760 [Magnetospirillum sp.]
MEGKAPSAGLEGAFSRFRAWLVSIYRALHGAGNAINDDIRGVFDRLIATDEHRAAAAGPAVRLGRASRHPVRRNASCSTTLW